MDINIYSRDQYCIYRTILKGDPLIYPVYLGTPDTLPTRQIPFKTDTLGQAKIPPPRRLQMDRPAQNLRLAALSCGES